MLGLIFGLWSVSSYPAAVNGKELASQTLVFKPFIYGGKAMSYRDAPWQAVIYLSSEGTLLGLVCGGSVVAPHWILTAAHCFHNPYTGVRYPKYMLGAGAGSSVLSIGINPLKIVDVIVHPNYRFGVWENDIALVKIGTAMSIPPMALAAMEDEQSPALTFRVTGWGKTENAGISDKLLYADVPEIPLKVCMESAGYGTKITEQLICAGKVGSDTCKGDSGGPLYKPLGDGAAIQFGLTVAGEGCGINPGVYSRVSRFREWITSQVITTQDRLLDNATVKAQASICTPERQNANKC